ncbi:MAG: hypothetical protein HC853_08250 [Anaerolineae bacterium]|nr:hypothetical protein [Anaerolineae bacterium]
MNGRQHPLVENWLQRPQRRVKRKVAIDVNGRQGVLALRLGNRQLAAQRVVVRIANGDHRANPIHAAALKDDDQHIAAFWFLPLRRKCQPRHPRWQNGFERIHLRPFLDRLIDWLHDAPAFTLELVRTRHTLTGWRLRF